MSERYWKGYAAWFVECFLVMIIPIRGIPIYQPAQWDGIGVFLMAHVNRSFALMFKRSPMTYIYIYIYIPIHSRNVPWTYLQLNLWPRVISKGRVLCGFMWIQVCFTDLTTHLRKRTVDRKVTFVGMQKHWKCAKLMQPAVSTGEVSRHCAVHGFRDHSHSTLGRNWVTIMVEFVWTYPKKSRDASWFSLSSNCHLEVNPYLQIHP